jgi:hypothetical protein
MRWVTWRATLWEALAHGHGGVLPAGAGQGFTLVHL